LFIADTANHRIRRVDAGSGIITTFAGTGNYAHSGDGGPAASADVASPSGLAFDPSGNLYFRESTLGYVRKISPFGIIATIAGGGTGGDGPALGAHLVLPAGLAVDAAGNPIYIRAADESG